jgi:hypothetical protein
MTWGMGNVADASIATIAKDLRARLMGHDARHADWALDHDAYTVEEVANRLAELVFDELDARSAVSPSSPLGLLVAGYSAGERASEAWLIEGNTTGVVPVASMQAGKDAAGWFAYAQGEAVARLIKGFDPRVVSVLSAELDNTTFHNVMNKISGLGLEEMFAVPPMPFADAIKLAQFMVDTTVGYARFHLGPDTVGGPVEVAGISRYEGFKWVSRKHYYTAELNPDPGGHQ